MSLNSSFPVILLLVRLILFRLISFKPFLLQLYLHLLTSLTHPFILEFFPPAFKQACITPLLKKPTLKPTLLRKYRPISFLAYIAKTMSCVQPSLCLSHTEQPPGHQPVYLQKWTLDGNCLVLSFWSLKTRKRGFQVFFSYLAGSVRRFWYGQPPDPSVNPIEKGQHRNHTPVV